MSDMLELEWFRQFCGAEEDIAAIPHSDLVQSLCDVVAILGTEDLPPQPEGTTFDMLANKILSQATAVMAQREQKHCSQTKSLQPGPKAPCQEARRVG